MLGLYHFSLGDSQQCIVCVAGIDHTYSDGLRTNALNRPAGPVVMISRCIYERWCRVLGLTAGSKMHALFQAHCTQNRVMFPPPEISMSSAYSSAKFTTHPYHCLHKISPTQLWCSTCRGRRGGVDSAPYLGRLRRLPVPNWGLQLHGAQDHDNRHQCWCLVSGVGCHPGLFQPYQRLGKATS